MPAKPQTHVNELTGALCTWWEAEYARAIIKYRIMRRARDYSEHLTWSRAPEADDPLERAATDEGMAEAEQIAATQAAERLRHDLAWITHQAKLRGIVLEPCRHSKATAPKVGRT
jgi:hypothetical protein